MGFSGGGTGSGASTVIPIGSMAMFGGAGDPSGWLICDGRSLAVASFGNLHAVIGFTFGGSGANFNIPDLQTANRFARAATNDAGVGNTGGAATVTLTGDESGIQAHVHTFSRAMSAFTPAMTAGATLIGNETVNTGSTTAAAIDAHNNEPQFIDLHYIIKV